MATPTDIVQSYLDKHYPIITWPHVGDSKGPKEKDWPRKTYTISDYTEKHRVGLLTGSEVKPNQFLHDIDIDWAPGSIIAQKLLPATDFVFGRASKRVSHCFYLLPEALPSFRYEDVDKVCLVEIRGTKINGELGFQTMVPPSVWTKEGKTEPLIFIKEGEPSFIEPATTFKQRVCYSAIGMMLAKHFGHNGFGHEMRLAWAGFLLRAGVSIDDLVTMGEAISLVCNNLETIDVRRVVESTARQLSAGSAKVVGGPKLAKMLGDKGKSIIALVNEWLGRDNDFIRDKDGSVIKDNQENVRRALQLLEVELSDQTFAEKMLVKEHDGKIKLLDDAIVTNLWLRIDRDFRFRPSYQFFEKVVRDTASSNSWHPVRDYFGDLPSWDGKPRIDTWLIQYGKASDTSYCRAVASIVLIAAVRRILQPGCKYDEMLVLESPQGMNKSSSLRALCPKDEWFSDDLPLDCEAKEIIERTLGKWIIEAGELTGGRKADRDHLKSMLSRQIDGPARMAYARFPVERPRQFIIIGTTNSAAYLMDSTGARRFWPIAVQNFDIDGIRENRDQIWAEALQREAQSESIRLPENLWGAAAEEQENRLEVDAWELVIQEHVRLLRPHGGQTKVSAQKLWELIQPDVTKRDQLSGRRISEIMQRLKFKRQVIRINGEVTRGYVRTEMALPLSDSETESED